MSEWSLGDGVDGAPQRLREPVYLRHELRRRQEETEKVHYSWASVPGIGLSAGTLKMRYMKMQDWKMRHKAADGGKCRNGKSGKRKV